jgi:hypothetical protein
LHEARHPDAPDTGAIVNSFATRWKAQEFLKSVDKVAGAEAENPTASGANGDVARLKTTAEPYPVDSESIPLLSAADMALL